MRGVWLGVLLGVTIPVMAGELTEPPPLPKEQRDTYLYLTQLKRHHNNLVITTTNPDGNIRANPGELLVYNNASSYKMCVNVSTTGEGTLWRCSANALTAP